MSLAQALMPDKNRRQPVLKRGRSLVLRRMKAYRMQRLGLKAKAVPQVPWVAWWQVLWPTAVRTQAKVLRGEERPMLQVTHLQR